MTMETLTQTTAIETGSYGIDPVHSRVGFEVKHLGISTFRGSFSGFSGNVTVVVASSTGRPKPCANK